LASASQSSFHKDYVPPRKDSMPPIKVLPYGKYSLETSPVPPSVSIEGDILVKVVELKFADHDITDEKKFLELAREKYVCANSILVIRVIMLETQV
jgi:hypothetical protein